MQKFARHRTVDEIKKLGKKSRFSVNTQRYDRNGADHIVIHGDFAGHELPVLYNSVDGRFFGELPSGEMFSSDDATLDGQPWFDAMLAFFYEPAKAARVA